MERCELVVLRVDCLTGHVLVIDSLREQVPEVGVLDANLRELVVVSEVWNNSLLFVGRSFLRPFLEESNNSFHQLVLTVVKSVANSLRKLLISEQLALGWLRHKLCEGNRELSIGVLIPVDDNLFGIL